MSTKPKLTVLIATVGIRNDMFTKLVTERLLPQVANYNGKVSVLAYWDNFEASLGHIRQDLIENANSDYICFLDDDDDIPDYYIKEIMDSLKTDVDYVGWQMQLYHDGQKMKPTFHSLVYDSWAEDENGWYRNVSHLNPIKRKLALKGDFTRAVPEDVDWATQVVPYVKTEAYIDKPMYFYHHSTEGSLWDKKKTPTNFSRPEISSPYFKYLEIN